MKHSVKRIRRSEQQIRGLLNLQEEKNLTVTAFCKAHKIHKATFYNWRNKYGLKTNYPQQFVPVEFSNLVQETSLFAEIELTSRVIVRFFRHVDASYFKAML